MPKKRAVPEWQLICPDCRAALAMEGEKYSCQNGHSFPFQEGVADLLPTVMDETVRGDAVYHAEQREVWVDANQINAPRNLFFHRQVANFIAKRTDETTTILELGGGVGFDLELFLATGASFRRYAFSEIATAMAAYARRRTPREDVFYCCIDAHNIPFDNETFDFVTMIATLHHFPDLDHALSEITRVLKPGGYLICGIEPNKKWVQLLARTRGLYRRLMPSKFHSPADEEAEGFTISSLSSLGRAQGLEPVLIQPVWFFCGFLHYGLEGLYRILRLKKRLRLPRPLENLLILMDLVLGMIPGINQSAWHYTAIYRKQAAAPR